MKKIFENKYIHFILISCICLIPFGLISYKYGLNFIMIGILCLALILNFLYIFENKIFEKLIDNFVKYRLLICFCLFILCLIFKISGSSIGVFDTTITEKKEQKSSVLFGEARAIRSDEWVVATPYYFSQTYNSYSKISKQMSYEGQNMIIGYNSPVNDITVLAKPLVWGYMLLGNEYGLSWYWCLKIIFIFLASFEVCYILTKKNKKLSILGAILVTWGPSTQWWFVPHMPDVILWAMTLFSLMYHFLTNKRWIRNICMLLLPFITLEFVIALFPSFQIGLGYFIAALLIALIYRDKIKPFENKKQIFRDIFVVVCSLSLIGYFIISNKDALSATMNTAYPGARISVGGDSSIKDLFTDLATPFLSFTSGKSPYNNQSEDSTYIHFGIFVLLLAPLLISKMKKERNRDWIVGLCFMIILGIDIFFMIFGFPNLLAKITLFSYINRMKMVYGCICIFFTIWGFNALEKYKSKIDFSYYLLSVFFYCILLFSFIDINLVNFLPKYIYYVEILVYLIILLSLRFSFKNIGYTIIIALTLFSSIAINPIITGIAAITNHPSADAISTIISKDKDSYWMSYGNIIYSSYLLALGAKTINAVNFYPDYGKWDIIDRERIYDDVYNRYAHISATLSADNKNHIDYGATADLVQLQLTFPTMKNLNIKYIVVNANEVLENYNTKEYQLETIYQDSDLKIYQLNS